MAQNIKHYKDKNTIYTTKHKHQTQKFTKFYDMDSHAPMTMYKAYIMSNVVPSKRLYMLLMFLLNGEREVKLVGGRTTLLMDLIQFLQKL
jgi:hypothetical protein